MIGAGLDTSEGRSFVRDRLALEGKVVFLLGGIFFLAVSTIGIMHDHTHTPAPRPSRRAEQYIPRDLEQLVLDCLEKDPEHRPASMDELSTRLAACAVALPWTGERAERWWRAHVPDLAARRSVADVLLSHEELAPRTLRPQVR